MKGNNSGGLCLDREIKGKKGLKIAVLSGKGGTGKTFISVNLAATAAMLFEKAVYVDCDVEEPNGHLFFRPHNPIVEQISVMIPSVDKKLCCGCRKCVEFCRFNALAFIKNSPFVFKDICHSCGGCILLCPEQAMSEKKKVIGSVYRGTSQKVEVISGVLNTGEVSGVPIIQELIQITAGSKEFTVFDCPPGSACIVMESIKDADYCILVAEPTVFGAHNLQMVYDLVKLFEKPCGVVLNKCLEGENPSEEFCLQNNVTILKKIPFNAELGILNSNGQIATRENPLYRELFKNLLDGILEEVKNSNNEAAFDSKW